MKGKKIEDMSLQELQNRARKLGVVGASLMKKDKLRLAIKDVEENPDRELVVEHFSEAPVNHLVCDDSSVFLRADPVETFIETAFFSHLFKLHPRI